MKTFALALAFAAFGLAADQELVNMLPQGARMVAGMNMSQSMNSPFGRYLLSQMKTDDDGLRKFIDLTGFDPRRDLRELVVANYDGSTPAKGQTLVVARGNFDPVRVRAALLKEQGKSEAFNGFDLLSNKEGNSGIAFLNGATAVAGDLPLVKGALAKSGGHLAADIQARINDMSGRYDAWIFTTTPMSSFTGKLPDKKADQTFKTGQLLSGIMNANGGIKFGNTVQLEAELFARSEKDAQALHDVFKFVTGMIQLNQDNPEAKSEGLAALVDGMRVSANGSRVVVNMSVPEVEIERMLDSGKGSRRGGPSVI